jgi:hypothetical protein
MKLPGTHFYANLGWFSAAKHEISSGLVEIRPGGLAGIAVQENNLIRLDYP